MQEKNKNHATSAAIYLSNKGPDKFHLTVTWWPSVPQMAFFHGHVSHLHTPKSSLTPHCTFKSSSKTAQVLRMIDRDLTPPAWAGYFTLHLLFLFILKERNPRRDMIYDVAVTSYNHTHFCSQKWAYVINSFCSPAEFASESRQEPREASLPPRLRHSASPSLGCWWQESHRQLRQIPALVCKRSMQSWSRARQCSSAGENECYGASLWGASHRCPLTFGCLHTAGGSVAVLYHACSWPRVFPAQHSRDSQCWAWTEASSLIWKWQHWGLACDEASADGF